MMQEGREIDVFISFSFADQHFADRVARELTERHGIRCWICTRDIDGGNRYKRDIDRAIHAAKGTVLIWSANAYRSEEIPKEVDITMYDKKPVIPFKLDDSPYSEDTEYDLLTVQYIDARGADLSERIDALAELLIRKLKLRPAMASSQKQEEKGPYAWAASVPSAAARMPFAPTESRVQPQRPAPDAARPDAPRGIFEENGFAFLCSNGYATVISGPDEPVVRLPDTAMGCPVNGLADDCFKGRQQLREVYVPAGVRVVGKRAFAQCGSLIRVQFALGLKKLGDSCFSGCESLKDIILPDTLELIGARCFAGCTAMQALSIPERVTDIGEGAFSNRAKDMTVTVKAGTSALDALVNDGYVSFRQYYTAKPGEVLEIRLS